MSMIEVAVYLSAFGVAFTLACCVYVYSKEKEYKDQNESYSKLFARVSEEIHFIKKTLNQHTQSIGQKPIINEDAIQERGKRQVISIINDIIPPIVESIQKIDETFRVFEDKCDTRLQGLEKHLDQYTQINTTTSPKNLDHNQIMDLYAKGHTADQIASRLNAPRSQIDLVIKMYNQEG